MVSKTACKIISFFQSQIFQQQTQEERTKLPSDSACCTISLLNYSGGYWE